MPPGARGTPSVSDPAGTLLVPREMKVEHSGAIKAMTDEQIEAAIEANLSNLGIVLRIHTRHADAAHDLAVDHDRDAAFDQRRPANGEIFQSYTAARHRVVRALPSAIPIAARCEPSRRCSITAWPPLSTIEITTFQLFCLAFASAAAIAFLA